RLPTKRNAAPGRCGRAWNHGGQGKTRATPGSRAESARSRLYIEVLNAPKRTRDSAPGVRPTTFRSLCVCSKRHTRKAFGKAYRRLKGRHDGTLVTDCRGSGKSRYRDSKTRRCGRKSDAFQVRYRCPEDVS